MAQHGPRTNRLILKSIEPRNVDLGSFLVRRSLPVVDTRAVGPWVFFDHFGPARFDAGKGIDVIPHPHINLATVTYLFDGEIEHRDTIGSLQRIRPGAINLMIAGSGIAHSERTPRELRTGGHTAHGMQFWFALPEADEEVAPSFHHFAADAFREVDVDGASVRVLIGEGYGSKSEVPVFSPTLLAEATLPAGNRFPVAAEWTDRALYVVTGELDIEGVRVPKHRLTVLTQHTELSVVATEQSHVVLIGGEPLGVRHMWWNFVSSRKERIERAKADWKEDRYGTIPGETERYPLPESDSFSA